MRQARQIMGMPITIDIPSSRDDAVFTKVFDLFTQVDERFSTYKSGSELSRYRRGEIKDKDLSEQMKQTIKACKQAETDTDGYFSAYFEGKFNPTGYVKGWVIEEAGKWLKKNGFKTYCISAGGDILASSAGSKTWNIGLQDPADPKKILNRLSIGSGAVATSGTYERGTHIINPKTGKPAEEFISLTVTGPDIIKTDVLATAAFAMGKPGIDFINIQSNYEALAIDKTGQTFQSKGMPELLS